MSRVQRFFVRILPRAWAASMEAESRAWIARCESCGSERSIWDHGGIRWKAAGNPRRRLMCSVCDLVAWHRMHKKSP
jgi:hypothetical protein